ncbi:spore-associated protein A [Actinoallomurus sp. NPDC052308]|uniref:spore-associated protein A n=1 Tax=Actinoallomurus sp. NPDC052308 TaxID=3155530 RepID=UPI00344AC00C
MRRKTAALATVVLASSGVVAVAAPAYASGPCGSGYSLIDVYNINTKSGVKRGSLELYYSSASGKNCALAYGVGSTYGTTTWKVVKIARHSDPLWTVNQGNFAYYAGPVYVSAAGQCIDLEAQIDNTTQTDNGYALESNVHCG